jgi:hypothetical protein
MARRFSSNTERKAAYALTATAAVILALSCGTLFTPDTGAPEEGPSARSTPTGVIDQLFRSYEDRRIDLFTELLPKNGTYRFFMPPEFYQTSYTGTDAVIARIDTSQYKYVTAGSYHFWGQDSEIAKHRRLFSRADEIVIMEDPIIGEMDYRLDDKNDTAQVELRLRAGQLCIGLRDTLFCTQDGGANQVFLLEKEADGRTGNKLWVIKDWFDLK